jgi:DNA-binding MarR family transcriptional regulator
VSGKSSPSRRDPSYDLIVEVPALYFRLVALGKRQGAVTRSGGVWGFLRTLAVAGPCTVPAIAQMRPVSRQHIQTLADALAKEGLVEFVDNPRHRRSRLVQLTAKGRSRFEALDAEIRNSANLAMRAVPREDIEACVDTLRAVRLALPDIDIDK